MKNLKKLREAHKMSQQKLAEELFVTQQSIYKYENDLAYPTLDTLKLMSKIFSVSIDYIVDNEQSNKSPENLYLLNEDEKNMIENYRQLSPDVKKNILFLLNHIN